MAQEVLVDISLLIALAAAATIIARVIKQPAIIAYLVAGILAGPLFFNIIGGDTSSLIQLLAHIGVAFLLFIVGLSLDLRLLKEVGLVSVVAGVSSMAVTGGVGYLIAIALGMSSLASVYIAAVLAFSSTVVVVKILLDKKEIDTLHGRLALGILIVQDFVAAIALMAVPVLNNNGSILYMAGKFGIAIAVIIFVFVFASLVLNRFLTFLARSQETLFLFGIAWALILATLFDVLGFSLEIGALIAGMSLASSKYTLELTGKIKPLRDFFVVLFFVFFGSQLFGTLNWELFKIAIIFSIFILIGKPLITMVTLKMFGYKKRTNFLASTSLAQISEFSLILVLLGFSLGHLDQGMMNLTIIMALITIGLSSYGIYYSHPIFNKLSRVLNIFDGKGKKEEDPATKEVYDIVLFGYHRMGYKVLEALKEMKASFIVVDYNPKVVLSLGKKGINCVYGDASDKEFLEDLRLDKAKVIISTIPDEYSSLVIRERLDDLRSEAVFIGTAEQPRNAMDLYNFGLDYVLVPHHLGGDYAAHMIKTFHTDKKKYKEAGKKHVLELKRAKNNSLFG